MPNRLISIDIDDWGLVKPTPEMDQERKVAIFDLLEENSFAIPRAAEFPGPYRLLLALREGRLVFAVSSQAGDKVAEFVPVVLGLREKGLVEVSPVAPAVLTELNSVVASGVGALVLYPGIKLEPRPLRAEFRLGE